MLEQIFLWQVPMYLTEILHQMFRELQEKNRKYQRKTELRHEMKDTIIVSGGNIQKDFALDFLKKIQNRTHLYHCSGQRCGIFYGDRPETGYCSGRF